MSSFFDYGKEAEGKTASEPEKEHVAEQVKIKVSRNRSGMRKRIRIIKLYRCGTTHRRMVTET